MVKYIDAEVLFEPPSEQQRFLPEGPYRCPEGRLSWVAIQHGADAREGSLNVLDLATGVNQQYLLSGRPGFAFPTQRPDEFIVGVERSVILFNVTSGSSDCLLEGVDRDVSNTIINDGVVFDDHLIFGCKDLEFAEKKAGLYLVRRGERRAIKLSGEQVCSNGKAIVVNDSQGYTLYDIDSPSQQVLAWKLDLDRGKIDDPRVVVDLTTQSVFPDGMIITPDQRSLIVALYDPRDSDHGEAHLYDIASGELRVVWRCAQSPRVTCPQLIRRRGKVELVLTTADEGMPAERRARCQSAGCLFVAETEFDRLNDNPVFHVAVFD